MSQQLITANEISGTINVANTGIVGLITSAQLQPNLTLSGTTTMSGNLVVQGTTTTVNQEIVNTSIITSTSVSSPIINGPSTLSLQSANATAMSIDTNQNVNINKSLTVASAGGIGSYALTSYNTGTTNTAFLITNVAGYDNASYRIGLAPYTGTFNSGFVLGVNGATNFNGYVATYTNGTEAMRIDSSGNVGIGTASPGYKLDVYGTVRLGQSVNQASPNTTNILASSEAVIGGTGGNYLAIGQYGLSLNYAHWIQSSYQSPTTAVYNLVLQPLGGNVGIGTTSPSAKLQVSQAYTSDTARQVVFSDTTGTSLSFGGTSGGVKWINSENTGGGGAYPLAFQTGGTEAMRINSNGSVSILQTGQYVSSALSVNGPIAQTAAAGSYSIDISGNAVTIANGGTINFPNCSGMLIVNNWVNGNVCGYFFGGGSTNTFGSVGGAVGTTAYNSSIAGYTWTSNYGSSATYGFFFVRTRTTA
jgi:hypothetical protein